MNPIDPDDPPPAEPARPPSYEPSGQTNPPGPPGTNGMAIGSLVTSILGITCCTPAAIVGVILGVLAMRETRRTGQDGSGLALAGTVIGGLMIVVALLGLLAYAALLASGWSWS